MNILYHATNEASTQLQKLQFAKKIHTLSIFIFPNEVKTF